MIVACCLMQVKRCLQRTVFAAECCHAHRLALGEFSQAGVARVAVTNKVEWRKNRSVNVIRLK